MSATHGRSNLLVSGVKTRRRLDADEPDAAEGLGIASPATKWAAETIPEELVLARIQWSSREAAGTAELARAKLAAVAGVRWHAVEGLEGAEGQGSRGNDGGAHRGPAGVVEELGEGWSRRGGEDDLRRPEMKTTAPRMKRSSPGCFAR